MMKKKIMFLILCLCMSFGITTAFAEIGEPIVAVLVHYNVEGGQVENENYVINYTPSTNKQKIEFVIPKVENKEMDFLGWYFDNKFTKPAKNSYDSISKLLEAANAQNSYTVELYA